MDPGQVAARDREHAVGRTGGEDQPLVGKNGSIPKGYGPRCPVYRRGRGSRMEDDPILLEEPLAAHRQGAGFVTGRQVVLRQGRTLIGVIGLVPDEGDRSRVPADPQRVCDLDAGLTGPHDEHLLHGRAQTWEAGMSISISSSPPPRAIW